ncbi:MAG TPA: antibiotic ABC transporter ATP-binding protein, partial [Saprospirales bacterium]|nr:antibiotic ABC transporter ATP-binding protein [Saprospirales bacterium]
MNYISDIIMDTEPAEALKIIVLLFILSFLLKNIFRYLSMFFMAPLRNGFIRDLRKELFEKLLKLRSEE